MGERPRNGSPRVVQCVQLTPLSRACIRVRPRSTRVQSLGFPTWPHARCQKHNKKLSYSPQGAQKPGREEDTGKKTVKVMKTTVALPVIKALMTLAMRVMVPKVASIRSVLFRYQALR